MKARLETQIPALESKSQPQKVKKLKTDLDFFRDYTKVCEVFVKEYQIYLKELPWSIEKELKMGSTGYSFIAFVAFSFIDIELPGEKVYVHLRGKFIY